MHVGRETERERLRDRQIHKQSEKQRETEGIELIIQLLHAHTPKGMKSYLVCGI